MDRSLFDIILFGALLIIGVVFVTFTVIMAAKQTKQEMAKSPKANGDHPPEYTTVEVRATVAGQTCCVKTIGIKMPKTVKEFVIVFQTENNEILKLNVPEEMYDGFEQGQTGILSIVDGELYSFVLDDDPCPASCP